MAQDNIRIKYALYLKGWSYEGGDVSFLTLNAQKIPPNEFQESMLGHIFCPGCKTRLTRSPKNKPIFSNQRKACFVHLPSYSDVECDLRTPKPEGMKYLTEELALQAIADDQLVIVNGFIKTLPEPNKGPGEPYDQSAVEDINGPVSEIPIARYQKDVFKLPSRISTVTGICRKFDENLYKYYVLPGQLTATRLIDSLLSVQDIDGPEDTPRLYWGEIIQSFNAGQNPKPTNLRMTELKSGKAIKDFYLKAVDSSQAEKGINDKSIGRIVLFWGKITWNGIGLCIERPAWGEFSLLPVQYERLLKT
ncbi:hypothetical protein [Methylophilus sp. 3sh_L]|uniref:hypothetical protein n=1 Tax=Methylophilus sp. 3sh_L TaxID=3377114 RepID=UPI00398EBA35